MIRLLHQKLKQPACQPFCKKRFVTSVFSKSFNVLGLTPSALVIFDGASLLSIILGRKPASARNKAEDSPVEPAPIINISFRLLTFQL